jgi:peptide/nickel transport system substrate-binding protein
VNARHLLAGASLAAALTGCAAEAENGATPTLRFALINDPILNPVIAPDIGSVLINKVIYPGLVRPDEELRPAPDLAIAWEEADSGRTYTFQLRPNVKWHDGQPFTARDVKFTFDQILDLSSGSRLRSDFTGISSVEVIDSLTIRFRLRAPFASFLSLLGYNAGILPEHAYRGRKLTDVVELNREKPIGTGPFEVTQATPGSAFVLTRNPDYFGKPPALERLVFRIVPDVNVQVAQLRAGELDVITVEPANLSALAGAEGIHVQEVPVVQHYYVGFNQQREMFRSPLVRRALGYAVDREAIIRGVLKGHGDAPVGTIPVVLEGFFSAATPRLKHDPDSARAYLAQAGWKSGADGKLRNARGEPFRFVLMVDKGNPTREQVTLAVQQDLQRIGAEVTLRTTEFATLVRDHLLTGKFDAALIWWTTPPDPDQFAFYATGEDNNHVGWSNRRADSLLLVGRTTLDSAARRLAYDAFQSLEVEDPPVLVLFYPREILAMRNSVHGWPKLGIRDALRHSERLSTKGR